MQNIFSLIDHEIILPQTVKIKHKKILPSTDSNPKLSSWFNHYSLCIFWFHYRTKISRKIFCIDLMCVSWKSCYVLEVIGSHLSMSLLFSLFILVPPYNKRIYYFWETTNSIRMKKFFLKKNIVEIFSTIFTYFYV